MIKDAAGFGSPQGAAGVVGAAGGTGMAGEAGVAGVPDVAAAMAARIEALEMRIAYQDRALADLSAELFESSKRIELLEKFLREVAGKVKDLAAEAEEPAPGNVRPPHW